MSICGLKLFLCWNKMHKCNFESKNTFNTHKTAPQTIYKVTVMLASPKGIRPKYWFTKWNIWDTNSNSWPTKLPSWDKMTKKQTTDLLQLQNLVVSRYNDNKPSSYY